MNKFLHTILLFLLIVSATAQNQTTILIDSSFGNKTFIDFAKQVTTEKGTSIFFRNEWMKDIKIPPILETTLIDDILARILTKNDLHFIYYQDNIVIMPGKSIVLAGASSMKTLLIGNPLNEGKYRKATVSGTVYDGKTQFPIPGAQVICESQAKISVTDAKGHFEIELPVGRNQIRFLFMGLNEEVRDIMLFSDGEISVDLFEESISLDQVNVLAERPADNFQSTSMGMTKLNSKTIKKLSVLMGEPDLIKSMTMLPGVQSAGENASGFNVRGGNIDQNLIMIHDAPVFSTSHLFGLFSMLDANIIEDVTFYKSGIPARYGGRASSIMNIELKKNMPSTLKVDGGIGLINSRLSIETPLIKDKLAISFGGRTTYSDWMMGLLRDYELQKSSASFYDFNGRIDYKINNRQRINLFVYGSNDDFDYHNHTKYGYGNQIASIRWSQLIGNNLSGVFNINTSRYRADLSDFNEQNNEYNLTTAVAQNQVSYNMTYSGLNNHKLTAGTSAVMYQTEPGKADPYSSESVFQSKNIDNEKSIEGAVFVEDEWTLTPELSLLTGLRYSHFALLGAYTERQYEPNAPITTASLSNTTTYAQNEVGQQYSNLEPRIAFKWELDNTSSFKIGYNRMSQYVRQISNSASMTPADYWKSSDSFIAPLISDQIAAGYFRNLNNDHYETSIELYYKSFQNEVDFKNGAKIIMNDAIEQALVFGRGRAFGAELMIKKSTGRLTGWLSYTYSRSLKQMDGEFAEEQINQGEWYRSNYDKPHDLSAVLNYKISRRFTLSSNFTYSTGRPATFPEMKYQIGSTDVVYYSDRNKYRLPDYHRLDAAITYEGGLRKIQKWRSSWTFSVYNVYAHHNPFSVYYKKQLPSEINNYQSYALYKFSIIGVPIPSFTYNFWF